MATTQTQTLTAAQLAEIATYVAAQAALRQQITNTAIGAVTPLVRNFDGWWNAAAVRQLITQILRIVQPSQRQAAQITDAYLARVMSVLRGRTVRPVGAVDVRRLRTKIPPQVLKRLAAGHLIPPEVELGNLVDGPSGHINRDLPPLFPDDVTVPTVDPAEPYGRIADSFRYQVVATGADEETARAKAILRLQTAAHTDVTLAVRAQVNKSLVKLKADGYRRIVHPELSKTGPCGLCVVAADRVYKRDDLLPLHGGCVCEVLPILGGLDPGFSLDYDELQAVYAAAGGTGGEVIGRDGKRHSGALKKIRVVLGHHGEIGPVLYDGSQKRRGPVQVAKAISPDPKVRARAELAALETSYARLLDRQHHGEKLDQPIAWQRNRIEELQRELTAA